MRKSAFILSLFLLGFLGTATFTSCKDDAPTIRVNPGGDDGDVLGNGGSGSATHTWTNNQNRTELNMDITSSFGGSFQIVLNDADGTEVLNETLIVGVGDDSLTRCSASGASGEWMVTITLTDFDGDGSFTLSQGC